MTILSLWRNWDRWQPSIQSTWRRSMVLRRRKAVGGAQIRCTKRSVRILHIYQLVLGPGSSCTQCSLRWAPLAEKDSAIPLGNICSLRPLHRTLFDKRTNTVHRTLPISPYVGRRTTLRGRHYRMAAMECMSIFGNQYRIQTQASKYR